MSSEFDVVIVGAGPAGSSTAFYLLEQGIEKVLVLDKSIFPRDKLCGGGLTRRAQRYLDRMGVLDEVLARACQVPKTYIVTPSGKAFHEGIVPGKGAQMLVLNRRYLDEILLRRARERGATVREGVEVSEMVWDGGRCRGARTREGELLSAEVVVIATGSHSPQLTPAGSGGTRMLGFEGRFRGRPIETNAASLVFDEAFVPQYGWIFPESEELFNVGVGLPAGRGSRQKIRDRMQLMLDKYLPLQVEDAEPTSRATGFPICTTFRIGDLVNGNVVYVGEAGRLVDPFTFEGISQAMLSGRCAGETVATALLGGDLGTLCEYETTMKKEFAHFASMRWVTALLRYRVGSRLVEAVLGRKAKWSRAGRRLA